MRALLGIRALSTLLAVALAAPGCGASRIPPREAATIPDATPALDPAAAPYPAAPRGNHVDELHGQRIPDPYRWLEDIDSAETKAWIRSENELTQAWLAAVPERAAIRERLVELWDHARYASPKQRGDRIFFLKNDGLQNQSLLYVQDRDQEPRVLLDPNMLSEDGTVALARYAPSPDGNLVAWALAEGGSDWNVWHVRDVRTGIDLSDELLWAKFSGVSWTADSAGFFYARYAEPAAGHELEEANYFQRLFYHQAGTEQAADRLVYERPDEPKWGFDARTSDDGLHLVIHAWVGTDRRNLVFHTPLPRGWREARTGLTVEPLLPAFDASYEYVGNDAETFYFLTDESAPRGRVIAVELASPDRDAWKTILPERADTLRDVALSGDLLVASWLRDAHSVLLVHDLKGAVVREIPLPSLGSAGLFESRRQDADVLFWFTSFVTPREIHRYTPATGERTLFRAPEVAFDALRFVTRQVHAESPDGTRIPVFLVHRRDLPSGPNPTYLYGYGGFNVALTPGFSTARIAWLERGGVYAHAILRGGGEFGEEWHRGGMVENKQNVFDDFIAAAEHLVASGTTRKDLLAIGGRSNGGLLVAACLNQRPDLFGAVVAGVGVMDMLRFHRFTIGWAWTSDYGSPEKKAEFDTLRAYSPYHNIRSGVAYPPVLVTTADHDDRVFPAHSFKYAARLQAAVATTPDAGPILIRVQTRAGHGAGKPTRMLIDQAADEWAFVARALSLE